MIRGLRRELKTDHNLRFSLGSLYPRRDVAD